MPDLPSTLPIQTFLTFKKHNNIASFTLVRKVNGRSTTDASICCLSSISVVKIIKKCVTKKILQ